MLNSPIFESYVSQKKKTKGKGMKVFEEIIVANFPKIGKEISTGVQESQRVIQDKPKEKHGKTHTDQ